MDPAVWISMVLVLFSVNTSASQTQQSQCQQLRQKCMAADNGCESVWNLLEEVCFSTGDSCTVKDSSNCNKVIQFLINLYPEFKDCMCIKDNCSIKSFHGQQCFKNQGKSESSSAMDVHPKFLQQTKSEEEALSGVRESDCSVAKETCQADDACFTQYQTFQRVCRATCNLQQCLEARKALEDTVLGKCTCPEPVQKRCTEVWENIFNNTCLQHTQVYQVSTITKEIHTEEGIQGSNAMEIKSQWKPSALSNYEYKHRQSCFQVNVECVNDEVCNRQLALYLQACQLNGTQCNVHRCQGALRAFYENMPFNIAQMMTFCDCIQSDENCHQAKELLHGQPCAVHAIPQPSCLSVIHSCQADNLCWAKYQAFTSKCLEPVSQACLEDKDCLQFLGSEDLICSNSTECRAAYVSLWGSVLRVECTCDTSPAEELSVCRWFQQTLHSKSCLNQISGGKIDLNLSSMDLHGEILPATGEQSLSYDDTIIIAIYISCLIPILGIILLALVKSRACTTAYQAKTISPAHLSEKLMIPKPAWIIDMDNAPSGSSL
uniref:GDNF family receptor alpha-like n=1 Tax=Pogona vitticeps TaxID=103695 RepID=A0ABM5ETR3_9SAUR